MLIALGIYVREWLEKAPDNRRYYIGYVIVSCLYPILNLASAMSVHLVKLWISPQRSLTFLEGSSSFMSTPKRPGPCTRFL